MLRVKPSDPTAQKSRQPFAAPDGRVSWPTTADARSGSVEPEHVSTDLQSFIDNSFEAIILSDRDSGTILAANASAHALYQVDGMVGTSMEQFLRNSFVASDEFFEALTAGS